MSVRRQFRVLGRALLIAVAATTLARAQALNQDFSATNFPPAGWTVSGSAPDLWRRNAASGFGIGSGSAQAYFWGISSGTGLLASPVFDATTPGDALLFDYAYAAYYDVVDRLEILYSTNAGASYATLLVMPGGPTGSLTTVESRTSAFVPTAEEWNSIAVPLPEGANRVQFAAVTAYGNNLYVDNLRVLDYSGAADLAVSLSDAPDPVAVGSNLTYSLTVSNAGPAAADAVVLTNQWSAPAALISATTSRGAWSTNANAVIVDVGSLASGESAAISIVIQPQTTGLLTNVAEAATTTLELVPGNNRRTVSTRVDTHGGDLFFSPASYAVDEGRGFVVLTVRRTNGSAGAVSFDCAFADGSALTGSDYSAPGGTMTLANGQTSVSWAVTILNDALLEDIESFSVRLSNPAGGARLVAPSNATVTIRDDDGVAAMPLADDFESGVFSNYWSTYSTASLGPLITVSDGPYSGSRHVNLNGDFLVSSLNELILTANLAGQEGVRLRFWHKRFRYETDNTMSDSFVGHAYADGVAISVDGTTWHKVHGLTAAETGTNEYRQFDVALDPILAARGLAFTDRVRIKFQMYGYYYPPSYGRFIDDIALYTQSGDLRFPGPSMEVVEGAGALTVTVERVQGDSGEVSVAFATSNETALAESDYTSATGVLVFSNGQRRADLVVPILQDSADETSEIFSINLFNPQGGAGLASPSRMEVTIADDDGPGELVFSAANYVQLESGGLASITVIRRFGTNGAVTVNYRTAAGTAASGVDYEETAGTLVFPDGVAQRIIEIPLLDDNLVEGAETVLLFLEQPAGGATLGPQTNATLTLLDDEAPRAPFPFYEGFESGILSNYWSVRSTGAGRGQIAGSNAYEAARCLALDSTSGFALNEAVLTVDLAGQTSVILRCWARDFGDTPDPLPDTFPGSTNADGIAVSADGLTWHRLLDWGGTGAAASYTGRVVDLAGEAAARGIPLTPTFQIKFQHYGDAALTSGGRAFDHISLTPAPPATSTVIRFQGFEGHPDDTWDYSIVPKSGALALATARRNSGTRSARLTGSFQLNADPYLEFNNVSIGAYNNVQLSVAFSASGPDTDDDLYLDISYDNGATWNGAGSAKLVDGYSNAEVPFGGTNPANPATVTNNPWLVNIPAGRSQVKARLRFDERSGSYNNSIDHYFVDDIRLSYQPFGQPPRLVPIGDRTALVSNTLEFIVSADDIDHEVITLAADDLPPGAVFEPLAGAGPVSNVFRFTPDESQADAVYPVVFHATDGDGRHSETVAIRVLDKVVTFSTNHMFIEEASGGVVVGIRLSRSADVTVPLAITGLATLGADYALSATALTFTVDGPNEQNIMLTPVDDGLPEGPENLRMAVAETPDARAGDDGCEVILRDDDSVTIADANLTSGGGGYYRGPGERILQALRADIVAIQEFRVTNAAGPRAFVDQHFGTNFHYYVEPATLPNGVISRWPILAAGQWDDPLLSDREFVWATIDVPGGRPLHVVSVHFYYSGGASARESEARLLTNYLANAGFHPSDLVVVCGDLNTQHREEAALNVLTGVLRDDRRPADLFGDTDTNQNRDKPYDFVLPLPYLNARHQPVHLGGLVFPEGLVFDTRHWNPPPAPALWNDSGEQMMQHMAVMKRFELDRFVTLLARTNGPGTIAPAHAEVGLGSNQAFTLTAAPYHHIRRIRANEESWEPPGTASEIVWVWTNTQANGWLEVTFDETLATNRVPHFWLAAYGLTNETWDAEALKDADEDGMAAWEEYLADTNPTNSQSVFEVLALQGGAGRAITFFSSTARVYTVDFTTNAQPGGAWQPLAAEQPGGYGQTTLVDTNPAPIRIYRVRVRAP